jgi:hypothetical protein
MRTIEFDDCIIDVRPISRQPQPPPSVLHVYYEEVPMPDSGGGGGAQLTVEVPGTAKMDMGNLVGNEMATLTAGQITKIKVKHVPNTAATDDDTLTIDFYDKDDNALRKLNDVPVRGEYSRFKKLDFRLEDFPVFTSENTQRIRVFVDYYGLETAVTLMKVHAH